MASLPAPADLKCEFLRDPLGLGTRRPRLSWRYGRLDKGRAGAIQVVVAPGDSFRPPSFGLVWDSGPVPLPSPPLVEYGGPLESRTAYVWRARFWDRRGRPGPWSASGRFETGLLEENDWKAEWISHPAPRTFRTPGTTLLGRYRGDYVQSLGIYLRRSFEAEPGVRRARAYICGLGWSELWINGRRVGDRVLDPAPTDYRKRALYSTLDLGSHLARRNTALIILGNGRHIPNFGYGPPRAIAQLEIEYENGRRQILATDASWEAAEGPVRENGLYSGEVYDGRLEDAGASRTWRKAVRVSGYPLQAQALPPLRVTRTLRPRRKTRSGAGAVIVDFGRNFAGWVRIAARGASGTRLVARHAELRTDEGGLNTSPNQGAAATDVFVLRGRGTEILEPRFTYHGFRYAEISGLGRDVRLVRVEGRAVQSDLERTGTLRTSHSLINRIHANVLQGLRSNLLGLPTDCPQRDERQGWLADAHLAAEAAILNFDMAAFYEKFLNDIRDAQGRDGRLPDFVPAHLARLAPADPAWGSAYPTIAWLLYWYYGGARPLAEHYRGLKRYVDFLAGAADPDGIVRTLGKYGDWCPPGSIAPKKTPIELTSTWFLIHDALGLARIAAALGRRDEARDYARLASRVKAAFNRRFLRGGEYAAPRTSPADAFASQTSNVLPLALGLVPPSAKERVVARLRRSVESDHDFHLDTGILGTRWLLEVLTDVGAVEAAFRVATQTSYPGWGYMIQEGATTLWERWEKVTGGGMNSHNHIMLGSVDAWFYKTLAGVRCAGPGWSRIRIALPPPLPGLSSARARLRTVRGDLRVEWERSGTRLRLGVRVPGDSAAEIVWPGGAVRRVGPGDHEFTRIS